MRILYPNLREGIYAGKVVSRSQSRYGESESYAYGDSGERRKVIHENAPVYIYDTSGAYSDSNIKIDLKKGLPRLRESWIKSRAKQGWRNPTDVFCKERYHNTGDGICSDT